MFVINESSRGKLEGNGKKGEKRHMNWKALRKSVGGNTKPAEHNCHMLSLSVVTWRTPDGRAPVICRARRRRSEQPQGTWVIDVVCEGGINAAVFDIRTNGVPRLRRFSPVS